MTSLTAIPSGRKTAIFFSGTTKLLKLTLAKVTSFLCFERKQAKENFKVNLSFYLNEAQIVILRFQYIFFNETFNLYVRETENEKFGNFKSHSHINHWDCRRIYREESILSIEQDPKSNSKHSATVINCQVDIQIRMQAPPEFPLISLKLEMDAIHSDNRVFN